MVKSCCVKGCTSSKRKSPERKYYTFPSERARREKWKAVINRAVRKEDGTIDKNKLWSPRSTHTYVCSSHFITGEKVNNASHPDYVPSIFPQLSSSKEASSSKSTVKVDRYERLAKRARCSSGSSNVRKKLVLTDKRVIPTRSEQNTPIEEEGLQEEGLHSDDEGEGSDITPDDHTVPNLDKTETQTGPIKYAVEQSEREMLYEEINNLRKERDEARAKVASVEATLLSSSLGSHSVVGNNSACKNLTGVSWDVFETIFKMLQKFAESSLNKNSIPLKEQLFMTLVKLRHSSSFEFLAHVKGIPKTTVIDYFWKWINLMHLKLGFMVHWPDRECIFQTIPAVFKKTFPRVTSIIDCFEIFIEAPKKLKARAQCYSSYKKHCTVKFLIACTPLGSISFVSNAWGGRASDIKIVRQSGFIHPRYHMPGDQILADRGFTLKDDFATLCSAELLTLFIYS